MHKLLFVNNGSGINPGPSGGTTRLIELIKKIKKQRNFTIDLLTTEGSQKLFNKENLKVNSTILRSYFFSKIEYNIFDRLLANLISLVDFFLKLSKIKKKKYDLVYSSSDYIFDVLPCVILKIYNKSIFFSIIHHEIKKPLTRKGNIFLNLLSFTLQRFSFYLINKFSNHTFLYDTPEGKKISKIINTKKTFILNGINDFAINQTYKKKKYDICFIGGLRESKGIFDFVENAKKIKKNYKDLKVLIIGKGTTKMEKYISLISKENKFLFIPGLSNKKLLTKIRETKILISNSKEEGWGIVVLEAFASYTIVIGKMLPAFEKFKKFSYFSNKNEEIVKDVMNVLNFYSKYKNKIYLAKKFSSNFRWNKVLEIDLKKINAEMNMHKN